MESTGAKKLAGAGNGGWVAVGRTSVSFRKETPADLEAEGGSNGSLTR